MDGWVDGWIDREIDVITEENGTTYVQKLKNIGKKFQTLLSGRS